MKQGDIIAAQELAAIIAEHGPGHLSVDGSMPSPYSAATNLELDGTEKFRVVLNYGHEVQFHLVSEEVRAVVTTGLCGRCDDMEGWMA